MASVVYKFSRYGIPEEMVCRSLREAMSFAFRDLEYNTAGPVLIVDGDVRYGRDEMDAYWKEHGLLGR